MRERINKPKVFLSHARKDVEFIERIERDLRKCQIEPWRDQNEIRDGEPWQNVIFAEGLPACDVVIIYYTENSLASQMVSKEVDATLLRQLSDNGIGFLPYVNSDETRNGLRLDIKSLHCRVWNNENYYEILPSVIAEIWRRYMERSIAIAISQEKNRRLEAELEWERLKARLETSAFTSQEEGDFNYIYSKLKGLREITCSASKTYPRPIKITTDTDDQKKCLIKYSLIKVLREKPLSPENIYNLQFLEPIIDEISDSPSFSSYIKEGYKFYSFNRDSNLLGELLMHRLLTIQHNRENDGYRNQDHTTYLFSEKLFRFASWLDYHNKTQDEPQVEFVKFLEE